MDSAMNVEPVKLEPEVDIKEEEVFVIDEEVEIPPAVQLQRIRPLKLEIPIDNFKTEDAKPTPSTSRAVVAEVLVHHN